MKLKMLIEKSGYKKEFLANKIGVTNNTITNWVLGRTTPNIIQAQKLMKILGIGNIDEIIDDKKGVKAL